ncbi:MAG: hypothetical protein PHQ93_03735 [Sulfurimonas sp.]|uniref:hypothetical protein n=1 Tax=Sulfurimonas sp. TaxID=2022749 RepID=UPI00261349BD|nr:hypothetical protein [Sulfurimonas sp.]MDD5400282.1 hypothetical protein [Sulfurimonas sp.]
MQVSSSMGVFSSTKEMSAIKPLFTEKLSKDEVKEIREQIKQNANAVAFNSASIQGTIAGGNNNFKQEYDDFQTFLKDIGYNGKPIAELSKKEATELVSEDGFFGINQTSQRIADFVINGAGKDEDRFRAGREGMIQGFKEAEEMWGGKLPEISQKTMDRAIEMVDKAMYDLGFSILDKEV